MAKISASGSGRRRPCDLLCRLQAVHPDAYPDGLLRTVQRRLKFWRAQLASDLVFGNSTHPKAPDALRNLLAPRVGGRWDQPEITVSPIKIGQEHSAEATV